MGLDQAKGGAAGLKKKSATAPMTKSGSPRAMKSKKQCNAKKQVKKNGGKKK